MADKTIGELPRASSVLDDSLLVMEQQSEARSVEGRLLKEYAVAAAKEQAEIAKGHADDAGAEADRAGKEADRAAAEADRARDEADRSGTEADRADAEADRAELARQAIENLSVTAKSLASGEEATVTKTMLEGFVNLLFGIPRGEQGIQGPKGDRGDEITGVELVEGTHAPGTTDTYKVLVSDGTEYIFYVTNGRDGAPGDKGEKGDPGKDAVVLEADGEIAFDIHQDGHLYLHYAGDTPPDYSIDEEGHLIYTLPEEVA